MTLRIKGLEAALSLQDLRPHTQTQFPDPSVVHHPSQLGARAKSQAFSPSTLLTF